MAYLGKTKNPLIYYGAGAVTVERSKGLRKKMTSAEKKLWTHLRRKNILGMKFRRQQPVLFYIADFYCHELKLVIEVDGPIHKRKDRIIWDQNRRSVFEKFGIKILRFTNFEIKNHIGKVMDTIRNEILTQKRQELSTSNPQKNEK